jgi:hypothetical protein
MDNKHLKLAAILAVTLSLGVTTSVYANHFPAPGNLTCSFDGTNITADWDASNDGVTDAPKYGGDFVATYPTDEPQTFDFSVFAPDTEITVALSDLNSINGETADSVEVTVKALHPGQGQGRQNSAVSGPVDCGV